MLNFHKKFKKNPKKFPKKTSKKSQDIPKKNQELPKNSPIPYIAHGGKKPFRACFFWVPKAALLEDLLYHLYRALRTIRLQYPQRAHIIKKRLINQASMDLSNDQVKSKILEKIKVYNLTRADFFTLCYERPYSFVKQT